MTLGLTSFSGTIALVTGGASGIGLATATRLAAEGASVVIVDRNDEAGEKVAADLGGRYFSVDVASAEAWRALVAEIGHVDFAHLNAGVTTREADVTALTDDQYRRIMGANVDGVVFGLRTLAPSMVDRGRGAIVATASLAGLIAFAPDPIYTMTKHAVVGLVRSAAPQFERSGVSLNAVCPGIVDTPLVGDGRERLKAAGFPLIDPSVIAEVVVAAATGGESGVCWAVQPGRVERFEFPSAPGPRAEGAVGATPPGF
ncbi:MAG TPA: SDR family NAD(P)-dependent oxidoreductase [Acidimicrobiales bacterium]|nr:SDR family NAD(P)-dependent oxidoreductase [Acidimicrobiales bacterium]